MNLKEITTNLAQVLGINSLPEDQQNVLIGNIGELLQKRIMLRVVDVMDELTRGEFDELLVKVEGQPEEEENVSSFLAEKIPNMQEIIDEEVEKVKEEVKKDMEVVQIVS